MREIERLGLDADGVRAYFGASFFTMKVNVDRGFSDISRRETF
jgi:hypothetical protein